MKERKYTHPDQKIAIKFNSRTTLRALIKLCYMRMLIKSIHGSSKKMFQCLQTAHIKLILLVVDFIWSYFENSPKDYRILYAEWVDVSPKLIKLQQYEVYLRNVVNVFCKELVIPWIMKWTVEDQTNIIYS